MSSGTALLLGAVLLAGNAFFVGAEFALVSVRRSQIEPLVGKGSRRARATMAAIQRIPLMLVGAQLGVTICTVALGAVAEPAVAGLIRPAFAAVGIPAALAHAVAFAVALVLVVGIHVVVGEMVPKNLTLAAPDQAALALGPVLDAMVRATRPLLVALNSLTNLLLRLVGVRPRDEVADSVTHEEVGHLLAESRREGLLDLDEHRLTTAALAFAKCRATDVAMPLDAVVLVGPATTPAEIEELAARTGHSRYPRRDEAGVLSGYVHLKDVLVDGSAAGTVRRDVPVPDSRIRPLPAIEAGTSLVEVLAALGGGSSHLARIDDDQGSTIGILTLDDVLLRLVPSRQPQD